MHVIGHYDERVKLILTRNGLPPHESLGHKTGDAGILQPDRTAKRAIERPVEIPKFLARKQVPMNCRRSRKSARKRTFEPPGEEDCSSITRAWKSILMVVHGFADNTRWYLVASRDFTAQNRLLDDLEAELFNHGIGENVFGNTRDLSSRFFAAHAVE